MTLSNMPLTENLRKNKVPPVLPPPLLSDYISEEISEYKGGVGEEIDGEKEDQNENNTHILEQQSEMKTPKRNGKPKRRRGVPKLSESKLIPTPEQSSTNLIIRKLSSRINELGLKRIFAPYGEILSAAVMRNIHTGENLGTAFVRYANGGQATAALRACHGRLLHGRAISVHWARRQHDDAPVGEARHRICKLFVRNIPLDVTAGALAGLFAGFGPVGSVTLHRDTASLGEARLERRIAFVAFLSAGVAARAAEAVHNTCPFPSCHRIPVMVKLAEEHVSQRTTSCNDGSSHRDDISPTVCESHQHSHSNFSSFFQSRVNSPAPSSPPRPSLHLSPTLLSKCDTPSLAIESTSAESVTHEKLTDTTNTNTRMSVGQVKQQRYVHNPYSPHCTRLYFAVR